MPSEQSSNAMGGVRSSLIVGTSIAAWSLGAFAFYLVAGRALGPDAYGLVAALQSVIVVGALPVVALQWSTARVVAGSAGGERGPALAAYRRAVVWGTGGAFGLACIAAVITTALALGGADVPVVPLLLTYASLVAMVPLLVACGALQGEHRYTGLAWAYGASGVMRAPLLLPLLALPLLDVDAAMLAVLLAIAAGAAWAVWLTRADMRVRTAPGSAMWRDFLGGVPAAAVGLTGIAMLTNVDVIAAKLSIGGDEAGLFGAASVVAKALLVIPQALTIVLLPQVAEREARGQRTGSLLAAGILAMAVAGVAAMVLAVPLGEPVMRTAFGSDFAGASDLLVPFLGATTLLGALLILVNHHVARSDHRFVWAVGALAVVDIALLTLFGHSADAIIAIDAIVAGVGLVVHEMIYFTTDESMLRGAGAQIGALRRRMQRRDRGAA